MNEQSVLEELRILLVEDDKHDRVAFRRAFSKNGMASCQIAECGKAEEALELWQKGNPAFDLIVIDFRLPGLSGMELFRRLRDCQGSTPFVMLTGKGSEHLAAEALKAGFADYVVKDSAHNYLALLPTVLGEVVRRHREHLARQEAEKAMAESRKRLLQTLESITDAYFAMDGQWRIVELNAAAEREVFARPAAELMGQVIWELFPQARNTGFYRYYQIARDLGKPVHFEAHSAILDKWWEVHAYPREGRLEVYLKEISERKRFEEQLLKANQQLEARVAARTKQLTAAVQALEAEIVQRESVEDALRRSREQYSSLVQNSLTGIFIEQHGRIVFANQKSAEIYGYGKDEIIGLEARRLVHPEDRERLQEITAKRLQGLAAPAEYDARGITKSGQTIWIQRRNALIDYQGKPAILANHIDITNTKQTFEALERNQHQLKSLSQRLLSAQEDERKKIARELHDGIGSSLSAVKFRLDNLLHEMEPDSETAQAVEAARDIVYETIEEARRLMSDLRPAMLDDLGLVSTLRWFCGRFQSVYSHITVEQQLEVAEQDIPEHLKIVMFRVVQEAFNNIAKYSGGGAATLSLVKTEGALELTVADQGQGFDPEYVLAMEETGRGLGLTSMRERTELSGGVFILESSCGNGTRIHTCWTETALAEQEPQKHPSHLRIVRSQ